MSNEALKIYGKKLNFFHPGGVMSGEAGAVLPPKKRPLQYLSSDTSTDLIG